MNEKGTKSRRNSLDSMETSTTKLTPEQKARKKLEKNITDLISRLSPVKAQYRNHQVLILTARSDSVVLCLEDLAWQVLVDTGIEMIELDKSSPTFSIDSLKLTCAEDTESEDWIAMEAGELFEGKHIDIMIKGVDYPVTLDKKMIGVRLKKDEFVNISYRVKRFGDKQTLSLPNNLR